MFAQPERYLRLMEKGFNVLLKVWLILFLFFVFLQYERLNVVQASETWSPKAYEKGNHTLFVYHSPFSQHLRTSPNFNIRANNIAGELEQGSLFWLSNPTLYDNFPRDNVSRYNFFQVETFLNGKHESLVALSIFRSYLMDENEDFTDVRPKLDKGYLFLRSSPLVDWIYWTLKENGWNGSDSFNVGDFSYVKGGFYGTTLTQDVDLYNSKGEKVGRLEAGSRVFATWDLPFATGHNNPSLIRIVGYSRDNSAERVDKVGTFFIEGIKGNQRTITTISNYGKYKIYLLPSGHCTRLFLFTRNLATFCRSLIFNY